VLKFLGHKHFQAAGMTERSFFSKLKRRDVYKDIL
jgi:hypothetical protein